MDVTDYLRCFESSLSSYTGDDPLEPWDKFVDYLEQKLPAGGGGGMSLVFDRLVERFLNVERYADDLRYVNHCIRCASFYSDPVAMYVTSSAKVSAAGPPPCTWPGLSSLRRGMNEQADAVYQKALENQAQPADTVLDEYRQFQSRSRGQAAASAGGRNPLQNSHLTNQMSTHREPAAPVKASADCPTKPATVKTIITVSRSETSGAIPSAQSSGVQTVSEYMTDKLVCEGSELCFEEVRAEKYFQKLREKQESQHEELGETTREQCEVKMLGEQYQNMLSINYILEKANQDLEPRGGFTSQASSQRLSADTEAASALSTNPTQHSFGRPRPSNHLSSRRSLGLRLHAEPTFVHETAEPTESLQPSVLPDRSVHSPPPLQPESFEQMNASLHRPAFTSAMSADVLHQDGRVQPVRSEHDATHEVTDRRAEPEDRLNMSQGGTGNLSHITPNTSLGFVQATPSRVLPSPTVNTREALDLIMDMFQAPTLLEDPFNNTSVLHAEKDAEHGYPTNGGISSFTKPPSSAPFTVFQDDMDKENGSAAAPSAAEKSRPIRALAEIPTSNKPNDTPPTLMPDESTMWGARYNSLNSLAACPNSTTDFAMLAQFVSTPSTHKTPSNSNFFPNQENHCDGGDAVTKLS
ncbi:Mitotic checkpoint serine/threonine-protein kinase BUB1 [Larimichthys crocea]|uniref:Mitotic checkpoint serine/threonine-protein kinase BUB1 n=1 Tax=Larimichthys crocea TaxID=215358 RepID=A0A6G0I4U5_LARCR|nr:Mitotic checkpoint serine/threonine-protein kinase BUB1 [Larimichthys crocea]